MDKSEPVLKKFNCCHSIPFLSGKILPIKSVQISSERDGFPLLLKSEEIFFPQSSQTMSSVDRWGMVHFTNDSNIRITNHPNPSPMNRNPRSTDEFPSQLKTHALSKSQLKITIRIGSQDVKKMPPIRFAFHFNVICDSEENRNGYIRLWRRFGDSVALMWTSNV